MRVPMQAALLLLACTCAFAKAHVTQDAVVIEGAGNTAASVARDVRDASVFSYTPALGRVVVTRSLLIAGQFRLGSPEEWDGLLQYAVVMELDVTQCGSARIEVVRRSGAIGDLRLYRAKITSTHRTKDLDECKDANLLLVAGKLTAQDSTITGNINVRYEPGAEVSLTRSSVSFTRASGMEMTGVSPQHVRIADSLSVDNGLYGLSVTRLLSSPLEIARTVFRGLAADVFNGGDADVVLTDCDFKTAKFGTRSGSIRRRWTVTCHLPPRAQVVAKSLPGSGGEETVEGVAGGDGTCKLALTEYVGTPEAPLATEGRNKLTPHELTVYDRPGGRATWRLTGLHVFMPGQEVWFRDEEARQP
jgi:hypothetical protein